MATIRMSGATGNDDLRGDCHAILRVFLKSNPNPPVFDPILGGQGANTTFDVSRDIGGVSSAADINSFQIEHVSVEGPFETPDNWDMNFVQFQLILSGSFPQVIAQAGSHRFTGNSRVLDVPVLPPS